MGFMVSKKVLDTTTKCANRFACLKGHDYPLCEVVCQLAPKLLETFCVKREACVYCDPFDPIEGFCTCPTRIELYLRYGI